MLVFVLVLVLPFVLVLTLVLVLLNLFRLIILVEVARVKEAGSLGKVSLSEATGFIGGSWFIIHGGRKAYQVEGQGLAIKARFWVMPSR